MTDSLLSMEATLRELRGEEFELRRAAANRYAEDQATLAERTLQVDRRAGSLTGVAIDTLIEGFGNLIAVQYGLYERSVATSTTSGSRSYTVNAIRPSWRTWISWPRKWGSTSRESTGRWSPSTSCSFSPTPSDSRPPTTGSGSTPRRPPEPRTSRACSTSRAIEKREAARQLRAANRADAPDSEIVGLRERFRITRPAGGTRSREPRCHRRPARGTRDRRRRHTGG